MPYKTITLKEAAEFLGYAPKVLQNNWREILPKLGVRYIHHPNGRIRVIEHDVERYQEQHMVTHGGK